MARPIQSDSIIHPPSGSSVPGKEDANPFAFYPPKELRRLLETVEDKEELKKIDSALKQWERLYVYPGYPWRQASDLLRVAAIKLIAYQTQNPEPRQFDYYQDTEIPEGYEGILESLTSPHDQYDMPRFDYSRQGERPIRDIDTGRGDFLSPSDPVFEGGVVKPRGDGVDPSGLEYEPFALPSGMSDGWPSAL